MDEIKLVYPSEEYSVQILDYKNEFLLNEDSMNGTAGLANAATIEEWFLALHDNAKEKTVRKGLVPASTYLVIRNSDSRVIGMIDIRHRLNDYLFHFGGHIGYSVRKSERRKGYAKEMLRLALEKCREMQLEKILVTCYKDNIASAKTIQGNGGILEDEVPQQERITQRYWILL